MVVVSAGKSFPCKTTGVDLNEAPEDGAIEVTSAKGST